MNKSILTTYIKLFRPASVITMNMFIFVPILLYTKSIVYSVLQTIPFIIMIAGEIALNDCCDIEKDRISKPQRPLVNSNINIRYATIISICVIVISLLLSFIFYVRKASRILCFCIVTLILSFYNVKSSVIPLIKTIITAVATVVTLSFVYTYFNSDLNQYFFLGATFFFILGRELLMDIRDINGDISYDYKTIAVVMGLRKTTLISLTAFILSTVCALSMLIINFTYIKLAILFLAIFLMFFCYVKCIQTDDTKKQNKYILILWVPIIMMLFFQIV